MMIAKWINRSDLNLIIFGICIIFFATCTKIEREPKVETEEISGIMLTTAKAGVRIIDLGDGVFDHGHCWNIEENPTINDFKTSLGAVYKSCSYYSELFNLDPGIKYYVRAHVKSQDKVIYGNEVSFGTFQTTVTDVDGNVYNVIRIGDQVWMKENLKTTKYNDGSDIPLVTDFDEWQSLTSPGYCWYNNDPLTFKADYGAQYNFYSVATLKLCPVNWHVPSEGEWSTLITFLRGEFKAGGEMKEAGLSHWFSPNIDATNSSEFTALPAGTRYNNFYGIGELTRWWSSSELVQIDFTIGAGSRSVSYNLPYCSRAISNKASGFSVRCIRDY